MSKDYMRYGIIYSLFFYIIITISGCAAIVKDYEASKNRDLLGDLRMGMDHDQVIQIMDKPWKTESYMSRGSTFTVLYYVTQRIPDGTTTDEEMTPVVLKDDSLVGWGRKFFSDTRVELKQVEE